MAEKEKSDIIFISNARLSFPHLIEPQKQVSPETGKERISYNCQLILAPGDPTFVQFMQKVQEIALAKWKEHTAPILQIINTDRKLRCYGNGIEIINKKTFQPYDGYVGNVYITCGRDTPPQVIQADGKPIEPSNTLAYQALTRGLYGGCRVNVAIKPWCQENKYGRGIRCDLIAIQFAGDDTPFGEGAIDASGYFGAVAQTPAPVTTIASMPPFLLGK